MLGISLVGNWLPAELAVIASEANLIAARLLEVCTICYGMTPQALFKGVFGNISITRDFTQPKAVDEKTGVLKDWWVCQASNMTCAGTPGSSSNARLTRPVNAGLLIHELGHRFDYAIGNAGRQTVEASTILDADGYFVTGVNQDGVCERTIDGYQCGRHPCMQHPLTMNYSFSARGGEEFADMFMNWTQNSFAPGPSGDARYSWMNNRMSDWLTTALMQP